MATWLSDKYALAASPRLPDQLAAIIARQIEDGLYRPGAKLPPEARLSEAFGVSRSVVREALSRLKYEGLLESRQGRGVTVQDPAGRRSFRIGEAAALSEDDMAQFYEMRAFIEGESAALAARRGTPGHIDRLRECLDRMGQAVERRTDGTAADLEFHRIIAEMSGNKYLKELMEYLNANAARAIRTAREHSSRSAMLPQRVQREHEAIFRALQAGDAEAARASSRRHLANAARRLGLKPPGGATPRRRTG